MPAVKKERNTASSYGKATVTNKLNDHSSDPFVVKKVEEAKAFLQKNGFPGQVKNNN